jgi:hypothetical protein
MRRSTLFLALLFTCGCGAATGTGSASGSPPAPSPVAASPLALSCTASGTASPSWPGAQSAPSITSAVTSGDSLQLTFSAGTPQFQVVPQSSPNFAADPSGRPVALAGSAGVKIVLTGFQGGRSNYTGQASMTSSGPRLLQVGTIGDFEGTVGFGAGVSGPSCANVESGSSTLTFHFIPQP